MDLSSFGIDTDALQNQLGKQPPKVVPGRVAHIDADFTAYIVACDTVAEINGEKPLRDMGQKRAQVKDIAESITRAAGAEKYVLHVTPSASTKGGRADQAIQQEYQASRADKEPPKDLHAIRGFMAENMPCMVHMDQEADDGLAQANYHAEDRKLTVICSKDKDLRMVPGLHLDMDKFDLVDVPHGQYGYLEIDDTKSQKKVVGYGPAFFFAQCLMGDTADWIKGLPLLPARYAMKISPTQSFLKDREKFIKAKDKGGVILDLATSRVKSHFAKAKQIGPVKAYEVLKDVDNVKDAFALVRKLFNDLELEHEYEFQHWKTGERVPASTALLGDMQLLWMRRDKNPNDVLAWLKETAV